MRIEPGSHNRLLIYFEAIAFPASQPHPQRTSTIWPRIVTGYPSCTAQKASESRQTYNHVVVGGTCLPSRVHSSCSKISGCHTRRSCRLLSGLSVLLIERGTVQDSWLSRIPLPSSNHVRDGALSILTPAETSTLLNNRALTVSIGYGLGGRSLVNS